MKKSLGSKSYIVPLPVLILATYNEDGTANAMNAAWGTVSDMDKVAIYVDQNHKTLKNAMRTGAFTLSIADVSLVKESDYFGVVSGNDIADKVKSANLTAVKSESVNAPVIDELKLTLECVVESFDYDTDLLIGKVINTLADESILTGKKVDLDKLKPICYDTTKNVYRVIGQTVGFAFRDGLKLKGD